MLRQTYQFSFKDQKGTTFIEILVTVVIMGVGLLAVAHMQTLAMKSNFEADQRIIATYLMGDIISRLSSVPSSTLATTFADKKTIDLGTAAANPQVCSASSKCTVAQKIQQDIDALTGSSDLNKASACITVSNSNYLSITIAWDGIGKLKVSPAGSCGTAVDTSKRRTMTLNYLMQ